MIYAFSNSEKIVYEAIHKAVTRLETFADISGVKINESNLLNIYTRVIASSPMGYCYDPTRIEYRNCGNRCILYFPKLKEAEKNFVSFCSSVEFERKSIIEKASKITDPFDKVLIVYRHFVKQYDYCDCDIIKKLYHSAASLHIESKSVCEGFALAFAEIINALGIPCDIVSGTSLSNGNRGNHMWNIISLGFKYYHLDVTWDICTKVKGEAYDYFLLCDRDISLDHSWEMSKYPKCIDESLDWYRMNGAYVKSLDDLERLIKHRISEKVGTIAFRHSDLFAYNGSIVQIINNCSNSLKIPVKGISFSSNDQCKTMSFRIEY